MNDARTQRRRRTLLALAHGTMKRPAKAAHAATPAASVESYQSLQTDTANLDNSKDLLGDAQRSLDIARGRYKAGVGTFTELLNAQTALADAQKQRVQALSKWRTARLKLAASLGSIGLWSAH
ncbi:hypothetical protein ACT79_30375 [Burkholderia pseudomallei]|nr:hypothetical protein ACT79_30375 [Burkholderia pseudomallei]